MGIWQYLYTSLEMMAVEVGFCTASVFGHIIE